MNKIFASIMTAIGVAFAYELKINPSLKHRYTAYLRRRCKVHKFAGGFADLGSGKLLTLLVNT